MDITGPLPERLKPLRFEGLNNGRLRHRIRCKKKSRDFKPIQALGNLINGLALNNQRNNSRFLTQYPLEAVI